MKYKKVEEQEFKQFVDNYPKPLISNVAGIAEPPVLHYNDPTVGKEFVAYARLHELMKEHPVYKGERNEYFIMVDEKAPQL